MPSSVARHRIHAGLLRPEVQRGTTRRGVRSRFQSGRQQVVGGWRSVRALQPFSAESAGSCHCACPSSEGGLRRAAARLPGLAPCWPPPSRCVCAPGPRSNGLTAFEHFPLDLSAPRETLAQPDHETQNLCNSKFHFFSCFKHLTFPNCFLQFFSLSQTSYSLVALTGLGRPPPTAPSSTWTAGCPALVVPRWPQPEEEGPNTGQVRLHF